MPYTTSVDMSFYSFRSCLVLLSFYLLWSVHSLPTDSHPTFSSYDYGVDRSHIIKRQSSSPYVVTGIQPGPGSNGATSLRLEIRELEKDPTTWTLYILGLDMLQYANQTEMLSWYQVTGL